MMLLHFLWRKHRFLKKSLHQHRNFLFISVLRDLQMQAVNGEEEEEQNKLTEKEEE